MKPLIKILTVFITLYLFSCSTLKISYNWADYLLYKRIDSYFNLNSLQEEFIDYKLDKLHKWHRKKELPKYINFLEELKFRIKKDISPSDVDWFNSEIRIFLRDISLYVKDDASLFLKSLTPVQIKYFRDKISERNQKKLKMIKKERDERLKDKIEKTIDGVEEWTGDLSHKQKKAISSTVFVNMKEDLLKLNHQKNSQKRFLQILKNKNDPLFNEKLNDWFFNYRKYYSDQYKDLVIKKRDRRKKLFLLVAEITTKKQKENVIKKINEYIEQIRDLNKETP